MPPDVYLDLGQTFLRVGDVESAAAASILDWKMPAPPVAQAAWRRKQAICSVTPAITLRQRWLYERSLIADSSNVGVMLKLANSRDAAGFSDQANDLYFKALLKVVREQRIELDRNKDAKLSAMRMH